MNLSLGKTLALVAAGGIALGACGGSSNPPATPVGQDPASADNKASCSAGHTDDKNHCAAASGSASPPPDEPAPAK
ncbi:MAG TPA: hypothetical protein VF407_19770 [Polyangiaceae bacterium]